MRNICFRILRFCYMVVCSSLLSVFGAKFRQGFIRFSYKLKGRLFPEYGNYVPDHSAVSSPSMSNVWLPPAIPEWALAEMRELSVHIDPILYPTDNFIAVSKFYSYPVIPRPGEVYSELINACSKEYYTHCFAIPWMKRGGADLVVLKHIEVASRQSGAKILVLMTEPGDSPWLTRIPEDVDVLHVHSYVPVISHEELLIVISRVLIQFQVDVLHIINSRHTWEVVCKYGLALSQQTKIFASIYCDDYDRYGQPVGFARQYLGQCYRFMSKVFSDNSAFPKLLQQTYGYDRELFSVLKSPVDVNSGKSVLRSPVGRRVLWAGRIDRQKRPDLLLEIAKKMPDVEFHVYGEVVLDAKKSIVDEFRKTKNIVLLGGFDGVESLPFNEFPVFLYTSQWDGTPTMVIAAALASIPIVASSVGGVSDIINSTTGFPVLDIEDISSYVNSIRFALDNSIEAEVKSSMARQYVLVAHAESEFESELSKVSGYFPKSNLG